VQLLQPVLSHAETPATARRFTQAALNRPAAPFQQVAAGGQIRGSKHEDQDERGEKPGRIERQ
jgi:hypothetical protein